MNMLFPLTRDILNLTRSMEGQQVPTPLPMMQCSDGIFQWLEPGLVCRGIKDIKPIGTDDAVRDAMFFFGGIVLIMLFAAFMAGRASARATRMK